MTGVLTREEVLGLYTFTGQNKQASSVHSSNNEIRLSDYASIDAARVAVNSIANGCILVIDANATLADNESFDTNVYLKFIGYTIDLNSHVITIGSSANIIAPKNILLFLNAIEDSVVFTNSSNEEVSVDWFAANTTPGTTDMTNAIKAACSAASGKSGVCFSPEDYLTGDILISATGYVPAWVDFKQANLIAKAGTTKVLSIENPHGISPRFWMANAVIDCDEIANNGVYVHGIQNCEIRNIRVINAVTDGFHLCADVDYGIYYTRFVGLDAGKGYGFGNAGKGIKVESLTGNRANANIFEAVSAAYNLGDGISFENANGNTLDGCVFEKNDGYGINLIDVSDMAISGGYTEHNNQGYATYGEQDSSGSEDISIYFGIDTTGIVVSGGRHIGSMAGYYNESGARNKIFDDITIGNDGISWGGGALPGNGFNFKDDDDVKFRVAGANKFRWVDTDDTIKFDVATAFTGDSLTELTTDQDDYDSGSAKGWWRLSASTDVTITGIANGKNGMRLLITNIGTHNIIFSHLSLSSDSENRIITHVGCDITLFPDRSFEFIYDPSLPKWRMLQSSAERQWAVDMVLESINSANPNVYLGYGTWVPFGSGQVTVGYKSDDADFDAGEETGGAKTHNHPSIDTSEPSASVAVDNVGGGSTVNVATFNHTHSSNLDAIDHMNPYVVVYRWVRTE